MKRAHRTQLLSWSWNNTTIAISVFMSIVVSSMTIVACDGSHAGLQVGFTQAELTAAAKSPDGKVPRTQVALILRTMRLPPHAIIASLNAVFMEPDTLVAEVEIKKAEQAELQSGWMSNMTIHQPDYTPKLRMAVSLGRWSDFSSVSQANGFSNNSDEYANNNAPFLVAMRKRHLNKIIYVIHEDEGYAPFDPKLLAMFKKYGHIVTMPVDVVAAPDVGYTYRVHYP